MNKSKRSKAKRKYFRTDSVLVDVSIGLEIDLEALGFSNSSGNVEIIKQEIADNLDFFLRGIEGLEPLGYKIDILNFFSKSKPIN